FDLLAVVHDDRTPPSDRLVQGSAGHQKEPRCRVAGLDADGVTFIEDDEVAVFDEIRGRLVEARTALQQVRKDRMVGLDRVNEIRSRVQPNVEVLRVHDHVLDRAADAIHVPATTRIRTPRTCSTSGIWPALTSWYLGSIILFVFGRFTQSWKPPMRCRSTFGISWWMIPLPDVIHWTSPEPMIPLFPRLSSCST